ncbi:MAG: MerR family transcriptional regulator [Gammaproteobacteria bacterium]|nr:MerR family transcriptional regulator [Gammaproteobacteria bacterium]
MPDQESNRFPDIPEKLYFTIGEVSDLCGVKQHVLRYWEQQFTQLQNLERRANRRYYKRDDILFVRKIRNLLHEQGFTINGARQHLKDKEAESSTQASESGNTVNIEELIEDLTRIKKILNRD